MIKEYRTISEVSDPLMLVSGLTGVETGESAEVELRDGSVKCCTVLEINGDSALIRINDGAENIDLAGSKVRFMGHAAKLKVSEDMLGRLFDGSGVPIDGGPQLLAEKYIEINGAPANPADRECPKSLIETGISAIDVFNPLLSGQKMPIITKPGLPHEDISLLLTHAVAASADEGEFAVVFAAVGVSYEEAENFIQDFRKADVLDRTVVFETLTGEPTAKRIETLKTAMTAAEYLAFEKNMQVLFVMTDLTAYCDALREVAAAKKEPRDKFFYPRYLRENLAQVFECAGRRKGKRGTITFLPIMMLPDDNLNGALTEIITSISDGRIVLSRELFIQGIFPPIDILKSQSRFKENCIGPGRTRDDHTEIMNKIMRAYSKGLADRADNTCKDSRCSEFAERLETELLSQGKENSRTLVKALDMGKELLGLMSE